MVESVFHCSMPRQPCTTRFYLLRRSWKIPCLWNRRCRCHHFWLAVHVLMSDHAEIWHPPEDCRRDFWLAVHVLMSDHAGIWHPPEDCRRDHMPPLTPVYRPPLIDQDRHRGHDHARSIASFSKYQYRLDSITTGSGEGWQKTHFTGHLDSTSRCKPNTHSYNNISVSCEATLTCLTQFAFVCYFYPFHVISQLQIALKNCYLKIGNFKCKINYADFIATVINGHEKKINKIKQKYVHAHACTWSKRVSL